MKIGNIIIYPYLINIPITEHKSFEIELTKGNEIDIFEHCFRWNRKVDHAGIRYTFSIYKLFSFYINIYDHRHWNDEEDRYCDDGDVKYEN
jgi:hypothetical protein